jgi:catechol 2,3-dioxygenase-like lactoylglutathione lyase family enzyme
MTKNAENGPTREGATRILVSITPNFIVKDLQASIAFYVERLGFQVDYQGPGDGPVWGKVSRDETGIHFKEVGPDVLPLPNKTRHAWAPWDAYIYTLDPDTLFDEFRQRNVSFVKELSFLEEGLWGFEITDADGYVLAFFCLRNKKCCS